MSKEIDWVQWQKEEDFRQELNSIIGNAPEGRISIVDIKAQCSKPDMPHDEFLQVIDQITCGPVELVKD